MDYLISVTTIAGISIIMALSFYCHSSPDRYLWARRDSWPSGPMGPPHVRRNGEFLTCPHYYRRDHGRSCGLYPGIPALRIKGIYLLLLTLGFGEIVRVVFINFDYVGAAAGFPGIPYQQYTILYAYGVVFILVIFFSRFRRSRMGRAFQAIGNDETVAEILGVNITSAKLKAFSGGAFIAGIGGGILAHYQEYIEPLMFGVMHGVEFIVFTIFGGIQIFWGPIFGAFALTFMPEFFRMIQNWRMELYGVLLIVMMIVRPEGDH